jgi:hypothetical protein
MSDEASNDSDVSGEPHDWHLLDIEADLEGRQVTAPGEPNRYEVRRATAPADGDDVERFITVLDEAEFEQLRTHGPNPKGL